MPCMPLFSCALLYCLFLVIVIKPAETYFVFWGLLQGIPGHEALRVLSIEMKFLKNRNKLIPLFQSIYGCCFFFLIPDGLTFMWWGCYGLCLWHKPTELAHSFLLCSCVCFCLCDPFNCILFHKFSWRQLSAFSLCPSGHISALLVLSTMYLCMKVFHSPDVIPCGWLGLKHQLTN